MRMSRVLVPLLAVVLFPAGASPATMTLSVEPAAQLPALAPSLRVQITNDGATPLHVPAKVALQVVPADGIPFVAHTLVRGDERVARFDAAFPLVLAPGESRDVSFWAGAGKWWFSGEPRLLGPGLYRLQLVADEGLDSEKLGGLQRVVEQKGLVEPIVSNEATFRVIEPQGADLAVWNRIRKLAAPTLWSPTQVDGPEYADSTYATYAIPFPVDAKPQDYVRLIQAASAKTRDRVELAWHQLAIGHWEIQQGMALDDADVEGKLAAFGRARRVLEDVQRTAPAPQQRTRAAAELARIPEREWLVRMQKKARGEAVGPYFFAGPNCYEALPDGRRKVWFSYGLEDTGEAMTIPVGERNRFTPPPFDRNQLTTFPPDSVAYAFSIVTGEKHLVWHLDRENIQIRPYELPECAADAGRSNRQPPASED